jgi:mRNA interferase MazF
VAFPFSDLSARKFRPVLVISNDGYNRKYRDFVAIPLTSNQNTRDYTVPITNKEMASGQLHLPSAAKVDKIFSLEQSLVRRTFGQIKQMAFGDIKYQLLKLIE